MKMILGIVSIAILGYLVWHWFAPAPTPPSPPPKPATARPVPTKAPVAQRSVASAKPTPVMSQRRLAPEGTYFLVQRTSLTTHSGVIGFAPGTKVTLVEQGDSAVTVTDGEYRFAVPPSQLTNDLDLAASVANSDYTAQARISELTARWAQEYERQQREALAAAEKEKAQKKTRQRPTPKR
jgi:hypothetical protein